MSRSLLNDHYGRESLVGRVRQTLAHLELSDVAVSWDALVALDQFHVGGAAATQDLADKLQPKPSDHVIDIGCGLGGPARQLAARFACDVTGVDLNAHFIELANDLTDRTGLAEKVRFLVADAIDVPFAGGSFDVAMSQHVATNIEDRAALYREVRRLLAPGGRFATYDVVTGNGLEVRFPVPWARDPEASFLISADRTRELLEDAQFEVLAWRDATADGLAWQSQVSAGEAPSSASPRLGLPMIMGPQFPAMAANLGQNLREGRLRLLQAVVQRQD